MVSKRLRDLADQWIQLDRNPSTRKEIEQLLQDENESELEKRLGSRIAFGTAGLRGKMQAGFACMNDLIVTQAAQGLCMYLLKNEKDVKSKGIVIGFDGRYHSKDWANLTAASFISKGIPAYVIPKVSATPLVPYLVSALKCAAGVMVTASHNPKDDNGYKVYWGNGCQIIPPHDEGIASSIEENLTPWDISIQEQLATPLFRDPTAQISEYFIQIGERYCFHRELNQKTNFPIVFTAMHGVGKEWVAKAFEVFGLPPYIPVTQQIEPDPDFPTVPFPNPEEGKGALKLAIETAEANNSQLVIANDPDSDRLAVAERQADGSWKIFTGNETGILLGHWCFEQYTKAHPEAKRSDLVVLNTAVSSRMLGAMAEKEGLYYEETLTGFKWLGNKAQDLVNSGKHFLFAFEEAIGFMVGDICLDKDGVRGGAVFSEMAIWLHSQNLRVSDQLNRLYERYGYFETNNRYFFCYDPQVMLKIFDEIRNGGKYCEKVGDFGVKAVRDLSTGYDSTKADKKATLPVSASNYMITFFFENGGVATLRGSGTEPKLKYYVELNGPNREDVHKTLNELVDAIIRQLMQPEKFGLVPPKD